MVKGIDINIWKFLINRLDESQRKEILKRENIRIGSIQSQLVSKQSQWKIVLNRLNSELNNPRVQNVIKDYYIDSQVPKLKEDIKMKAKHLKELETMEEKDFEKNITEYGFLYVLLYLIVKRDTEKLNKLIHYESDETVSEKESDSSKVELTNTIKQLTELKNELSIVKKAHKGLQKKYDALEKKHNEVILKKSKEVEDALNNLDSTRKEYEEQLNLLIEDNTNLENLLQEESRKTQEIKENSRVAVKVNKEESNYIDNKKRKTKVLVFGDLPITVQKQEQYEFMFFDQDISTYQFNEDYDEYWCIEDKLSAKEKKQLQKSIYNINIIFEKKYYSELVR
ncbi:hypothetical protein [Bacillus sp. Cr_A10]|uniref:hypothetical protein n=1 Tax=Bacillus sp. Cr_A10 TaxID=3033993 RepID=UPI0023D99F4B|nr:hypothetical protein [Bacillus sp. Cr_A10]MDF2064961.1 hypothetical protein [Bacillus sp. Cr_A10]